MQEYVYMCMHLCVTTIKEKSNHKFEREQGRDEGEGLEVGE